MPLKRKSIQVPKLEEFQQGELVKRYRKDDLAAYVHKHQPRYHPLGPRPSPVFRVTVIRLRAGHHRLVTQDVLRKSGEAKRHARLSIGIEPDNLFG